MEEKTDVKKALVITGGFCNTKGLGWLSPEGYCCIIAADSGLRTAKRLGIRPGIIVGDFDSLGRIPGKGKEEKGAEIIALPCEKDVTDTMFACGRAADLGCRDITIIGGTGGRVDHTISNVFFLEHLRDQGIRAMICDGSNTVRFAVDETVEIEGGGGYFSVFAVDRCMVTAEGCRYPLRNHELYRNDPYAVSNEVEGKKAYVSVRGKAIIVTSR